jgi:cyanophycinase
MHANYGCSMKRGGNTVPTHTGTLIIIGGHEDKHDPCGILHQVAQVTKAARGSLLLITVVTEVPGEVAAAYRKTFKALGVKRIEVLDIRTREQARADEYVRLVHGASVVFFTGGDQLRLTSQLGDSPVFQALQKLLAQGGTIVGTSAGAAAMPETMIISGDGETSNAISALGMAPGLGLIDDVVIDSHFAERGRIGRLLGAVAQNPRNLGLGIDENTAIVVHHGKNFQVIGTGAVYVVDGSHISFSGLSDHHPEGVLSLYGVQLHVLAAGDKFDLQRRCPVLSAARKQTQA